MGADDYTLLAGESTPNVDLTGLEFDAGTNYIVQILSSKGNKFAYTATATIDSVVVP